MITPAYIPYSLNMTRSSVLVTFNTQQGYLRMTMQQGADDEHQQNQVTL